MQDLLLMSRNMKIKGLFVVQYLIAYNEEISLFLIQSVKSASLKYKLYLEEQRDTKEKISERLQLCKLQI